MSKPKADKVLVLKGQEAEDRVLAYIKRMNRPYGAVDVAANLKGAVPKTATQKILTALAEKGELVQKTYGKTAFFAPNQAKIETTPSERLAEMEAAAMRVEEETKELGVKVRVVSAELARLRATPTDEALKAQLQERADVCSALRKRLGPLRAGAPRVSAADLAALDAEWTRWRAEWVRRRGVFRGFWDIAADALAPPEAAELREELGIELDTPEHTLLEKGALCTKPRH